VTEPKQPTVAYDHTCTPVRSTGMPFLFEYVLRLHEKSGAPGVLDTRELGWPLLRSEDRIEDVRWHAG
jgi:hypothetical protein